MSIKELIKQYFELQKQLHEHFEYTEDWVTIPMSDMTDQYWLLTGEAHGGHLVHSNEPLTKESIEAGCAIYSGPIYTQRFLPKWVYRGIGCTMVCYDTQTDGNRYLALLSNDREQHDPALIKAHQENWG